MRLGTSLRIPSVICENWYANLLLPSNSMDSKLGTESQVRPFVHSPCDRCAFLTHCSHYRNPNNIYRYRSSYGKSWSYLHKYRNRHGRKGISVCAHVAELSTYFG